MTRRRLCLALAFAVAACGGPGQSAVPSASPPSASSSPGATTGPTAIEQVLARVGPDGKVSLEVALQAFAVTFGPLPGVEIPPGPRGELDSATTIVSHVRHYWDQLTPEQQAAARRLVRSDRLLPGAGTAPRSVVLAGMGGALPGVAAAPAAATDRTAEYQAVVDSAIAKITPLIDRGLPPPTVKVEWTNEFYPDPDLSIAKAAAGGPANDPSQCVVTIYVPGHALVADDLEWLMAHETFHCFQQYLATRTADVANWLVEGQASWVALDVFGPAEIAIKHWNNWLQEPGPGLYSRAYDALGFYSHLADQSIDVWPLLDPMLLAGVGSNEAAYLVAADAGGAPFVDSWGPGYHRYPTLGDSWDFGGIGIPHDAPPLVQSSLQNGQTVDLPVAPLAVAALRADVSAEVVVVRSGGLRGLLQPPSGSQLELAGLTEVGLCTLPGGCPCPPDSAGADVPVISTTTGLLRVGATGHLTGGKARLKGMTLEDFCQPVDECLLGTWVLDQEIYLMLLEGLSVLPNSSVTVGGSVIVTFGPKDLTVTYDELATSIQYGSTDALGNSLTITISSVVTGSINGTYVAEEDDEQPAPSPAAAASPEPNKVLRFLAVLLNTTQVKTTVHGGGPNPVSGGGIFGVPAPIDPTQELPYTCGADVLTIMPPGSPALTYRRASP